MLQNETKTSNPYPQNTRKRSFLSIVSIITLFSFLALIGPWMIGAVFNGLSNDPTAGQAFGWLGLLTAVVAGPVFVISLVATIVAAIISAISGKDSDATSTTSVVPPPAFPPAVFPPSETPTPKVSPTITPLLGAIITGDIALVQTALADHPEQLNTAYAQNGNTPLHVAALNGYTNIVRLLLEHPNLDTTHTNNAGHTALDLAREKGFTEIVLLLDNK